jgi:hypothetical protein
MPYGGRARNRAARLIAVAVIGAVVILALDEPGALAGLIVLAAVAAISFRAGTRRRTATPSAPQPQASQGPRCPAGRPQPRRARRPRGAVVIRDALRLLLRR